MASYNISAKDMSKRAFDFIIVGGGTAGLAIAARLAENPSYEIGVLEAGTAIEDVEDVDFPGKFGSNLGSSHDWQFETVPQTGFKGRVLQWPRGKCLGGTSLLNFMTWNRASKQDYDAWEELGCEGWGWEGILPFFKKAENFHDPSLKTQLDHKAIYDAEALGTSGAVEVCYGDEYSASHRFWHDTLENLGVDTNKSHLSGSNVGAWTNLATVDPKTGTRSSSATAYYRPNQQRLNLTVLTEALVEHVILEKDDEGAYKARGVRFTHLPTGESFAVSAAKEVILCAGSVQSPQILELSGIGNPEILSRAAIETKVASLRVGENLQDHIMAASIYEVDSGLPTPDDWKTNPAAATAAHEQFIASKSGPFTILANSVCYLSLSQILSADTLAVLAKKADDLEPADFPERDEIRRKRFDASLGKLGQIEYFFDLGNWNPFFAPQDPSKKYGTALQILQYPFSRGSIHITSSSPLDKPAIDPRYYAGRGGQLDLAVMVECAKFAGKITQTQPLAQIVHGRVAPPAEAQSDEELREWLVKETICDWHPVGTCGMGGSRGIEGGVVDARLRVFGVPNLRVVDASIMPMQISAHSQATVYAIAEKGAHMILEDWAPKSNK